MVYFKSAFARRYCRAERRSTLPHPQPHVTTPRNHPTVGCNPFHHPYPLVTCWMIRCGLTDLPAHAPGHDVNANAAVLTVSRSYYCTIRFYKVEIRSSVLVANEIRSTECPDSIKGDSIREISLCATISDLILRWVICFRYIVILVYGSYMGMWYMIRLVCENNYLLKTWKILFFFLWKLILSGVLFTFVGVRFIFYKKMVILHVMT